MIHLGTKSQRTEIFVLPSSLLLAVFKILSQAESQFERFLIWGCDIRFHRFWSLNHFMILAVGIFYGDLSESEDFYPNFSIYFHGWLHLCNLQECLASRHTRDTFTMDHCPCFRDGCIGCCGFKSGAAACIERGNRQ